MSSSHFFDTFIKKMSNPEFIVERNDDPDDLKAYVSNDRLQQLNIPSGSVVSVKSSSGNQTIVTVIGASFKQGIIKLNRIHRVNLGAYLGETVKISNPIRCPEAQVVLLSPISDTITGITGNFTELLQESAYDFTNIPIYPNFIIPVNAFQRTIEFQVVKCTPNSSVIIPSSDVFSVRSQSIERNNQPRFNGISYDDIGAIDLRKIRTSIERPLLSPNMATKSEPQSILISAPGGCGKTLLASAVTNETSAPIMGLRGSDILSIKTEAAINFFNSATQKVISNPPFIVFIDDIDAIGCQQYNDDGTPNNQLTDSLIHCIQQMIQAKQVVVIATARHPEILLERVKALFAERMDIPMPNEEERLQIAQAITRKMTICGNNTLKELAHKYRTGADIEMAIQKELTEKMIPIISKMNPLSPSIPIKVLEEVSIGSGQIVSKRKVQQSSQIVDPFSSNNSQPQTKGKKGKKAKKQTTDGVVNPLDPFGDIMNNSEEVDVSTMIKVKEAPKTTTAFPDIAQETDTSKQVMYSADPFGITSTPASNGHQDTRYGNGNLHRMPYMQSKEC